MKVFCLWDYNTHTGFATVSANIKKELKNHFGKELELHICAINYFGEPYEEEDGTYVFSAVKSAPKKDNFGRLGFMKILQDSNEYDGIFICQDLGVIVPIISILKIIKQEKKEQNRKGFKSIFYFPVDCPMIDKLVEGLEFFDTLVTYTEYGRNEVLKLRPELKGKLKVINHGNNTKDFFPMPEEDKLKFRKEYFGENADKFIITNINRNQPRKDIPTTIFAFIEAKKNWKATKEPFLYLHMNPKDGLGWDIRAIMLQTDLVENVDYKLLDGDMPSVEIVNKIYNASDLFLTTTLGEGWGLSFSEAAATKTPIIAPKSTSFIEMSDNGKRCYLIEDLLPTCNMIDNVVRLQCDLYETAEWINYVSNGITGLYDTLNFEQDHNEMKERAYVWAKSIEWKTICKSWIKHFKETF